jgi:acylphosphatase
MLKHTQIEFQGQIEKQGNRFHALVMARSLDIKGSVEEDAGHILIEAEGEASQLEKMIAWFREYINGNRKATIRIEEKELVFYDEFRIV